MPPHIRPATPADQPLYRALADTSFQQKWADAYSAEDMAAYRDKTFSEAQTAADLTDPHVRIFLAMEGGEALGYSKLSTRPNAEAPAASNPIELERLYLLDEAKGRGLGTALLNHALDLARTSGHDVIWLGVWEGNTPAVSLYTKHGFRQYGEHPYAVGKQVDMDWLMMREV